jgi:uncharacterized Zn finger protein
MSGTGGVSTLQPRQWWGRAWNAVADGVPPAAARAVQRGQALSRRGAVDELRIDAGRIAAVVAEDRGEDRRVSLTCPVASDAVWDRTIGVLADELRFTAALLEGELPEGIDEVLLGEGLALVPTWDDLDVDCGCTERGPICRHVAAVHAAAGVAIDRDPFLLFRLRGRDRGELLAALRERRGLPEAEVGESLDLSGGLTAARGDLEAIALHPVPVDDPSGPFRHLGPPPGVEDEEPLIVLIERAAAAAWRLAAGDGSDAADEELLLAELRAQRVATPASLAEALGRDAAELRQELDRLFSDGQVMRTGTGDRARYRAASGPVR